jgi:methionyl-tRNA formyltransferase
LYLGPPEPAEALHEKRIVALLRELKAQVEVTGEPLKQPPAGFDLGVSCRFRHKVPASVLARLPIVNLHMGYLPHGRGAHPLFWAVAEGSPIGGTVHWMAPEIDTGNIIAQARTEFPNETTLREAYAALEGLLLGLLRGSWAAILNRTPGRAQLGSGTQPYASELPPLPQGWETTLEWVRNWGEKRRG